MKATGWARRVLFEATDRRVVSHAGVSLLRLAGDRLGLTELLSVALARPGFTPRRHDPGRVVVDAAVMMADGGDAVSDIAGLRAGGQLFGAVASPPTLYRALDAVDDAALERVWSAMRSARQRVWPLMAAGPGGFPAARVPGGDLGPTLVLRMDANWVEAHSLKEHAARQRGGFGLFPISMFCDNTSETMAVRLRGGDAGAGTAIDQIELVDQALAGIPDGFGEDLLITVDGAGQARALLAHIRGLNRDRDHREGPRRVRFSVGWSLDKTLGRIIAGLPDSAWQPMLDSHGRPGVPARLNQPSPPGAVGQVTEITSLVPERITKNWPEDIRIFIRRVKPLRGTNPSRLPGITQDMLPGMAEAGTGWRYDVFANDLEPDQHPDPAGCDAIHRAHARVETRIRVGRATGAANLPSASFQFNKAWLAVHAIADTLTAWTAHLSLPPALRYAEPKTLRHRLWHTPALLRRGGRYLTVQFPTDWPWTSQLLAAINTIITLPVAPRPG